MTDTTWSDWGWWWWFQDFSVFIIDICALKGLVYETEGQERKRERDNSFYRQSSIFTKKEEAEALVIICVQWHRRLQIQRKRGRLLFPGFIVSFISLSLSLSLSLAYDFRYDFFFFFWFPWMQFHSLCQEDQERKRVKSHPIPETDIANKEYCERRNVRVVIWL